MSTVVDFVEQGLSSGEDSRVPHFRTLYFSILFDFSNTAPQMIFVLKPAGFIQTIKTLFYFVNLPP